MTNFLNRFINISENIVDSPREFIEGAGLSLISTTLGRYYRIVGGRGKQPNLYVIISCAPGIGRRGAINKLFNKTLNSATSNYCQLAGFKDPKESYKTEKKSTSIESGSPAGLVDCIEELKENGARSFLLNSPEFGIILDGIKNGGYMAGFNHLLCKLYSGEGGTEDFSRRGDKPKSRLLGEGTYFGTLGFMQKAEDYLDEKLSKVGLLRRLLLINKNGEDMTRHLPAIIEEYKKGIDELEELGKEIGEVMYECYQKCEEDKKKVLASGGYFFEDYPGFVNIVINDDVKNEINRIEKEQHTLAKNNDSDPYYLYVQSRWEYILKIAVCYAIAEGKVLVKMEHLVRAKKFVESCNKDIEPVIRSILVPKVRKEHIRDKETILKFLKKNGESKTGDISRGVSWMGLSANKRTDLLVELLNDGRVKRRQTVNRGNPTIYWKATDE